MKKKLRILVCLGGYKPELAGGAKSQENIISKLRKKINFNIVSFSKNYDDDISLKLKKIYRIKSYNNFLIFKSLLKLIIYFISIKNFFDVLHLRGSSKRNLVLLILGKLFKKKIIFTPTRYEEDDVYTIKSQDKLQYFFMKKIQLLHCMAPIFYSLKNSFVKKKFKYVHIPNLVDTNLFKKKKIKKNIIPNILCVGFFSNVKNQILLYKAWLNINKKVDCTLTFVGKKNFDYYLSSNDIYKYIYSDAKSKNFLNKIKFIDYSNNMPYVYSSSDIFVLPTLTEGMPNSLIEAMSCELPCIVTDLKNITSQIIKKNFNGYLFKKNNINDLEKYLIPLLKSSKLRKKIGKRARKHIEKNYSFKNNIYKYERMYFSQYNQNLNKE